MEEEGQGATPRELLIEACRRNNTELLEEVISDIRKGASLKSSSATAASDILNHTQDSMGNGLLHLAAVNDDTLDILLDQEGLEIDGLDRMEKDTPLHKAVRYANGLDRDQWTDGQRIIDILLDAGCDPRLRNKAKLKPMDLVDPRNKALRTLLQKAEFTFLAGDDVVVDEAQGDRTTKSDSDSD